MATDAELNEYVGLKKLAPYRKKRRDEWDPKGAEKLKEFKGKVHERTGVWRSTGAGVGDGDRGGEKKRKGKKERQKAKLAGDGGASARAPAELVGQNGSGKRLRGEDTVMDGQQTHDHDLDPEADSKKRKKRKRSHGTTDVEA